MEVEMLVVKSLYIDKFKIFKKFEIGFNDNLSVIVGENGTGKTTILEVIYNMLSGNIVFFETDENYTFSKIEFDTD